MLRRFSIQSKIVFPYTLLFAAVIVATSLITIGIVYRRMDERIDGQMEHMAEAIANMKFLLSDDFLRNIRIREVVGADIIVYAQNGAVTATTLRQEEVKAAAAVIQSVEVRAALSQPGYKSLIRNVRYLDKPHKVFYRRLDAPDEGDYATLSLMASTADIALAKRRSAMTIALVALSGILLVAIVGTLIARSITAPVTQLVQVTEYVAAGDLTAQAKVKTRDEIQTLANAFNQMTRELRVSRDKLVASEKLAAVGQLAAGIAHEIRNPLTSIKMIVQLLKRRLPEDDPGQESVQAVLDEINRLEIVITGLLDFARPTELALKPANVADVANEVLNLMKAELDHRKIELVTSVDEKLPETMLDVDKMKQVFMNVILNAMQGMSNGGTLAIDCCYSSEERSIRLDISDTGSGMSPEVLAHAFEPFFSTRSGGTGLGLANAKKIMDQHGQSIQIESTEGKGTKVVFRFEVGS